MDFIKFICVVFMIFIHAHMVLVTNQYMFFNLTGFFYKVTSEFMFLGLFLTILPALAGYVFGMKSDFSIQKTFKLAIFLSVIGFFMNAITWGWGYTFSWNILQFIGLSFLVIAILKNFFSDYEIFLLSMLTVLTAAFLRENLTFLKGDYLAAIFIGSDNRFMFWPFFPWFGVVGAGFLYAAGKVKYARNRWFDVSCFIGGVALIILAILGKEISPSLNPDYVWSPSIFQPELGFLAATIGLFLVLVVLGNVFFNQIKLKKYGIISSYSKGILWIYVAQMFVSYKLSIWVRHFFPIDGPSWVYITFIVFMLAFSWLIGFLSIKILQEKRLVISLKKYDRK